MPVISHVETQILVSHLQNALWIFCQFSSSFLQESKPPLGGSLTSQGFEVNGCAGSWLCLRGIVEASFITRKDQNVKGTVGPSDL